MDNSVNMGETQPGLKEATKSLNDENFPVASRLIPAALRPHVHSFYFCVRAADDVADDPEMSPDEKTRLLTSLDITHKFCTIFPHHNKISRFITGQNAHR